MIAADLIAGELARRGVRHVFGVGGANIEDMFAAVARCRPEMQIVLGKHEHAAGTAADAYARLTGRPGVVMTTSGGGAMNLVHSLAEARASRVPVLAIVGEPPSDVQGVGAFQDTSGRGGAVDAAEVFRAVSAFCARVDGPARMAPLLDAALEAAAGPLPGPAVLLMAKDLQRAQVSPPAETPPHLRRRVEADLLALDRFAKVLQDAPVVVLAGDEVARAGAAPELARLVRNIKARVAVTPDARDAFDNGDPRFLGVAGAMGHGGVARTLTEAHICLLVGTRLPLLARQGLEPLLRAKPLLSLAREPPFISGAGGVSTGMHVGGDLRANLAALAQLTAGRTTGASPEPEAIETPSDSVQVLSSPAVLRALQRVLPDGGVLLVDAGNTGAQSVHHLRVPRDGRWLIAMGMAGMGWSFGAAVGAACATGQRCFVLAGDGAFFMQGLDVHTALQHRLPITYVLFNNRAHGMCLVRERLLLGQESGYNTFGPARLGAGLAAMFPGLPAWDCGTVEELEAALARAVTLEGPSVICAELPGVEVPPFTAFQQGGQR